MKGLSARWVLGAVLVACSSEKPAAPAGLRVPLPDGWVATPRGGGLEVGPKGRVTATLEVRAKDVPRSLELSRAVTAEGATNVTQEDGEGYAAVRYSLGAGREGFLAVKKTATKTVWCASTAKASAQDIDDGLALCRSIGSE